MASISYRPMTTEDFDTVQGMICDEYILQEPLLSCFAKDPQSDSAVWFDLVSRGCLDDGLSLVAVDSTTNRVVGAKISAVVRQGCPAYVPLSKEDPNTRNVALLCEALDVLYKGVDIFEKFNCDKYASFRGISVLKAYQNQGIASTLVEKSLELIRQKNIKVTVVEATNKYSQRIFSKKGFQTISTLVYRDAVIDGVPLPATRNLELHKQMLLMAKEM